MRVFTPSTLRGHWTRYADAEEPLKAWLALAERASWQSPHDIKADYASASILSHDRVVFNVKGNTYRLVVAVSYAKQVVLVKFSEHTPNTTRLTPEQSACRSPERKRWMRRKIYECQTN